MRIGSAVIFLFLALVALGFLLSNSISMYQELGEVKNENQRLVQQISALQTERDALVEELTASEHQVEYLKNQLALRQEQSRRLEEENIHLRRKNSTLQSQIEAIGLVNKAWSSIPSSLNLMLLLPILPITAAASYVLVRYSKTRNQAQKVRDQRLKTLVQLTDDEVKEIIRIRRKK